MFVFMSVVVTVVLVCVKCECFVMQMLYVCVLCASCGSSQYCTMHAVVAVTVMHVLLFVLHVCVL